MEVVPTSRRLTAEKAFSFGAEVDDGRVDARRDANCREQLDRVL